MAIITNFQSPFEYEELVERYETPGQETNLDYILQSESDLADWTVDKNCEPGDTVFFMCAKTSKDHMGHVCAEARRHGNPDIIAYAEKERALYREYAGKILAMGKVAHYPEQLDPGWEHTRWRSPWFSDFVGFHLSETPVSIDEFRSFITISRTGAITRLDASQENQLLELIAAKNANLCDPIAGEQQTKKRFEESKRIAEHIGKEVRRNRGARILCIEQKGSTCVVCGFNSKDAYGVEGIVHAHHVNPFAEMNPGETRDINPTTDLEPVCPNCHALIHSKGKQEWYTIEEARELVASHR